MTGPGVRWLGGDLVQGRLGNPKWNAANTKTIPIFAINRALAERAGLSAGAIAALEQGTRRAPYRDTVNALSEALGLSDAVRRELERAAASARRRHRQTEPNLPVSFTSFVERNEVSELQALLRAHRLVTITGSGGVGTDTGRRLSPTPLGNTWTPGLKRLQAPETPCCFMNTQVTA